VTLRDRDTMKQIRVPISELPARVAERVGWSTLFA
jgi:glycyl-tRNA synthetase (class II)